MIKITPEGIHYVAKTLIVNRYVNVDILKFYDYEKVVFLNFDSLEKEKIEELKMNGIQVLKGINVKKLDKTKDENIIKIASIKDIELNQAISIANVICDLELSNKGDSLRYRSSNFNQVIAKQFVENNIILAIKIDNLFLNDKIVGRIRQNLNIARQYKVPVMISTFDGEKLFGWYEAMQFLRSLL